MDALDWAVVAIAGVSLVAGVWRGGVREALGLASWFVAWWAARMLAASVQPWLPAGIAGTALRHGMAFVLVFVVVLVLLALAARLLTAAAGALGLGGVNRLLGALFGLLRGLAIVLALFWLAGWTSLPHSALWMHSALAPYAGRIVRWFEPLLPVQANGQGLHFQES